MTRLFLTVGCPSSGKSTYIRENVDTLFENPTIVSRDEIRFSLLEDEDDYFKKEKEVFRLFVQKANEAIAAGGDVILDATHITKKSRNKILSQLNLNGVAEVVGLVFDTPLEECLKTNEQRKGRAYVPSSVIEQMYNQIEKIDLGFDKYFTRVIFIRR